MSRAPARESASFVGLTGDRPQFAQALTQVAALPQQRRRRAVEHNQLLRRIRMSTKPWQSHPDGGDASFHRRPHSTSRRLSVSVSGQKHRLLHSLGLLPASASVTDTRRLVGSTSFGHRHNSAGPVGLVVERGDHLAQPPGDNGDVAVAYGWIGKAISATGSSSGPSEGSAK
jgi:hypothetical protein